MLKRNNDLCVSEKNDEIIIMDMEKGEFWGLQDVSFDIWKLLDECNSEDQLTNRLIQLYEVDKKEVMYDVNNIIKSMKEKGMVIEE